MSYGNFNNRVNNIVTTKDNGVEEHNSGVNSVCNTTKDISIEKVYTKGEDGVGIEDILFNEDGTFTIILSDGSSYVSESIDGEDGKDGIDGVDGKDGEDGKDGLSAYEIWLDNGNTGSESDYLLSLKGDKGDDGADGYTPIKGVDYFDGIDGEKGDNGESITIENTFLDTNGDLVIEFSDSTSITIPKGADGVDGSNIELRRVGNTVQWKPVNETSWNNLFYVSELKGDKGDKGDDGADGALAGVTIPTTDPEDGESVWLDDGVLKIASDPNFLNDLNNIDIPDFNNTQ